MVRLDYLIFGFRRIFIDGEDAPRVITLFIKNAIRASISEDGIIIAKEKDINKIQNILSGRINFTISNPLGLYGVWKRSKHKALVVICTVISVLMLLLSQGLVWDIRPLGNQKISNADIKDRLVNCGFSVGDLWKRTDLSDVETELLRRYDDVSWVNINRRGTVAYVSIIEKEEEATTNEKNILYSNIIASCDCVIDEMTVSSGTAVVKAGDSVKKGDLLIFGADAKGDFCRAEGRIIGRVSDAIRVDVQREYEKRSISSNKVSQIMINIFKISINIFKTYGNLTNECDIIENVKEYTLPGGSSLPFSISISYLPIYTREKHSYNDEELIQVAKDRLSLATAVMLAKADLVRIVTNGEFTDGGYKMWSDIVYLTEVGCENSFEITD